MNIFLNSRCIRRNFCTFNCSHCINNPELQRRHCHHQDTMAKYRMEDLWLSDQHQNQITESKYCWQIHQVFAFSCSCWPYLVPPNLLNINKSDASRYQCYCSRCWSNCWHFGRNFDNSKSKNCSMGNLLMVDISCPFDIIVFGIQSCNCCTMQL